MYQRHRIEWERHVWDQKLQLRLLKAEYHARIASNIPRQGRVVEVGSGCGGMKQFLPQTIASDIFLTPWVDLVMSAERLALADASVGAVVGIDVLHHLEQPLAFFREAARVLRPSGKLILIDPYVSLGSWIAWHFFHHEKCSMREAFDFAQGFVSENNARATLWFGRYRAEMESLIQPLTIEELSYFDVFYYPLIGGFRLWSLIPQAAAPVALRWDCWLGRRLGRRCGYRMLIVLRKAAA